MRVSASVKKICRNCKIIRRKGVVRRTNMARIAGINIPPHQHAEIGLTAIFGIGRTRARKICEATGIPYAKKVKDLTDGDLEKIRDQIANITIEGDLRRETTMNIKRLMDIGCYRGFRH
eukprot:gene4087-5216_t